LCLLHNTLARFYLAFQLTSSTPLKHPFAAGRNSAIEQLDTIAPPLHQRWQYSASKLQDCIAALHSLSTHCPAVLSLAVAGSYGRMEAAEHSDLDLVIVVDEAAMINEKSRQACVTSVWQILEPLGMEKPLSTGIFMQAVSAEQLCDTNALGNLDYPRHVFGLRMQLLLDAQPVYGACCFQELMQKIVAWYSRGCMQHHQLTPARYLLNDIIRYYRSYGVWHQFDDTVLPGDSWGLRQVKINHSRMVSYAALLALVHSADELTADNPMQQWQANMMGRLHLTPLERLQQLHTSASGKDNATLSSYNNLLDLYAKVLMRLADKNVRKTLLGITAAQLATASESDRQTFDELMLDCNQLRSALGKTLFSSQWFKNLESDGLYALLL